MEKYLKQITKAHCLNLSFINAITNSHKHLQGKLYRLSSQNANVAYS